MTENPVSPATKALDLILELEPEVYVDLAEHPRIMLPLVPNGNAKRPYSLDHRRVKAELTGYLLSKSNLVLTSSKLGVIILVLESQAWQRNRPNLQLSDAINEDQLLDGVIMYLNLEGVDGSYDGTCKKLLDDLKKRTSRKGIDVLHDTWPKGPGRLSFRLKEIKPWLNQAGITVETEERTGKERSVQLQLNPSRLGDGSGASS